VKALVPPAIRSALGRHVRRIRHSLAYLRHETGLRDFTPRGHPHSPLPAIEPSARHADAAMRRDPFAGLDGIRLNADGQKQMLARMGELAHEFDWPGSPAPGRRFYTDQPWLNLADGFALYAMLRTARPRRVVEVGSGFSSALMLDARERGSIGDVELVFIEPDPQRLRRLLREQDEKSVELIAAPIQDVPAQVFASLSAGDVLFVDSSHVSRAGSDVNRIVFEILPRLAAGVWVHFHDVFWPFEYPSEWIRRGLAWNEAYLLRSFLMFNDEFEIAFWAPYAAAIDPERVRSRLARFQLHAGQSIWIRRVRGGPA
jgi:predicted O-methyltransferase YrrM